MAAQGYKILDSDRNNQTREYMIDTVADLEKLPSNKFIGSVALCAETGDVYILNTKQVWVKL